MNRVLRVIVLASFLFLLPTAVLVAQGELTLESVAEALAKLTDRVDDNNERLAALETRTAPTPTPAATPNASGNSNVNTYSSPRNRLGRYHRSWKCAGRTWHTTRYC